MAKRNLKDLMASRTPLAARETVQPANLYDVHAPPASAETTEHQQAGLLANQQIGKPAPSDPAQTSTETDRDHVSDRRPDESGQQAGLLATQQISKPVKKC